MWQEPPHEHALSFATTVHELAIVPYAGSGVRNRDVDTSIVHSCEHYDMSLSDDDEQWGHAFDEPQDVDISIVLEDLSKERSLATFGRGRGRSSKGKGRLGGRKCSATPWSSLQPDKPSAS